MGIDADRAVEVDKYAAIYGAGVKYTMNERRRSQSVVALDEFMGRHPNAKTMLDVGCGDGSWMRCAAELFSLECTGVDPVPSLANGRIKTALATSLPFGDNSFDVVTCLDVMEHLVPRDTALALSEIARVARYGALISVNNNPSHYRGVNNSELHINIKTYVEWGALFLSAFGSAEMLNNSGANRIFIVGARA